MSRTRAPTAAFDGDPTTAWVATAADQLGGSVTVDHLRSCHTACS